METEWNNNYALFAIIKVIYMLVVLIAVFVRNLLRLNYIRTYNFVDPQVLMNCGSA